MGRQINPIYEEREVITDTESEQQAPEKIETQVSVEEHEFYIVENYKKVAERIPELHHGRSYSLLSFGQWSLKHLVFHVAKLIGPCDVVSTTFGLGPGAAKGIVKALEKGIFTSFQFLFDNKVREYKEEAYFLCESTFPVKITSIHAKVTVLRNEKWSVMITGSANWSDTNNKIEHAEIIVNRKKADFFYNLIESAVNTESSVPSEILKELGYEL